MRTKFGRGTLSYDETTFQEEIEKYINDSIKILSNPANKKYWNYHRQGPGELLNKRRLIYLNFFRISKKELG